MAMLYRDSSGAQTPDTDWKRLQRLWARPALIYGKKLAEMMRMTKGGVSKLTAKLQEKGLIRARRVPDNRREVNYSLTENGWEIFRLHAKLHDVMYANVSSLIQKYDRNERLLISDFLEKIIDITQAVPKIS
jgi:DNA-binding MarR family transcriptional regulator